MGDIENPTLRQDRELFTLCCFDGCPSFCIAQHGVGTIIAQKQCRAVSPFCSSFPFCPLASAKLCLRRKTLSACPLKLCVTCLTEPTFFFEVAHFWKKGCKQAERELVVRVNFLVYFLLGITESKYEY